MKTKGGVQVLRPADLHCPGEQASEGLDGTEELVEGEADAVLAQVVRQVPPPLLH